MREYLFSDCSLYNNCLYFYASCNGIPAKLDLQTKQISILNYPSHLTLGRCDSIDLMASNNQKIYALRNQGDALIVYDTCSNSYLEQAISCNERAWGNFIDMFVFESKLYIFPKNKNSILSMDCDKNEIEYKSYRNENGEGFMCGCHVQDKMWLFPQNGNVIGCVDLRNYAYKEFVCNCKFENIVTCSCFEDEIVVLDRNGNVYCWNTESKDIELCFSDSSLEFMGRVAITKRNMVLLPSRGDEIKIFDKLSKRVMVLDNYPDKFQYKANPLWSKFHGRCEDDDKIYFAMRSANYLLVLHKETGDISWLKPELPSKEIEAKYLISYTKELMVEEEVPLYLFLRYIPKSGRNDIEIQKNGEKIWSLLK